MIRLLEDECGAHMNYCENLNKFFSRLKQWPQNGRILAVSQYSFRISR